MMYSHFAIAVVLTALLLAAPVILMAVRKKLFQNFSLSRLTQVLNWTFLIQILLGLTIALISIALDRIIIANDEENTLSAIIIETTYTYIVTGAFVYMPCLALLNLINWLITKLT